MDKIENLLESTKSIVQDSAQQIINHSTTNDLKDYYFDDHLDKEVKALADSFLDEFLLSELQPFGIPILTEESGLRGGSKDSDYLFIVDPLDGTYNYIRNFGSSAISVALFKKNKPIFGVIFDLGKQLLYWGGSTYGAYCGETNIKVSNSEILSQSLVCSGFPVRYDMDMIYDDNFLKIIARFAKVRMIGSAAISIVNVAKGASDAYFEKNIMLWDIAAGIALLEGAGGKYSLTPKEDNYSYDVLATNKDLFEELKKII